MIGKFATLLAWNLSEANKMSPRIIVILLFVWNLSKGSKFPPLLIVITFWQIWNLSKGSKLSRGNLIHLFFWNLSKGSKLPPHIIVILVFVWNLSKCSKLPPNLIVIPFFVWNPVKQKNSNYVPSHHCNSFCFSGICQEGSKCVGTIVIPFDRFWNHKR